MVLAEGLRPWRVPLATRTWPRDVANGAQHGFRASTILGDRPMISWGFRDVRGAPAWAWRSARRSDGDRAKAERWVGEVRARRANMRLEHFVRAFPYTDPEARARITRLLCELGF